MSSPDNPQFELQPPARPEPAPLDPTLLSSITVYPPLPPAPPPARDPVWSGWDVLQIAALAIASIIGSQIVILIGAKLLHPDLTLKEVAQSLTQKALLAIAAQLVVYIAVAVYMVMVVQIKYHAPFWKSIRWNWPRNQLKFVGLGALVLVLLNIFAHFLPMPKSTPFEELFSRPLDAYLVSFFAITLGPLMEELFFRGFLYPVLARRLGVVWGILLTALPFGLMHMFQYGYAWGIVLVIFLMGVVCTGVRAVTGSVASSFLVHVGYNATEMLLVAIATGGFRHMEKIGLLFF